MQPLTRRSIVIDGPAGGLEALVDPPASHPRGAAVLCHPHPLHEGTMHNKVVHTLARAFRAAGVASVRFNFRGVGASAGVYDEGRGEHEDAAAVAAWAQAEWPGAALALGGFSFGAAVAYSIAGRVAAQALVTVALPVERVGAAPPPRCPWLTVHGGRDELVPAPGLYAFLAGLEAPPELEVIERADHFFHGELETLAVRVAGFLRSRFAPATGAGSAA